MQRWMSICGVRTRQGGAYTSDAQVKTQEITEKKRSPAQCTGNDFAV